MVKVSFSKLGSDDKTNYLTLLKSDKEFTKGEGVD